MEAISLAFALVFLGIGVAWALFLSMKEVIPKKYADNLREAERKNGQFRKRIQ